MADTLLLVLILGTAVLAVAREEYRLRDLIERLNLALDAHFVDRAVAVEAADYLNELYLASTEKRACRGGAR